MTLTVPPAACSHETNSPKNNSSEIAVLVEVHSSSSVGGTRLVTYLNSEGRVLWSQDRLNGGPPYYEVELDRSIATDLLEKCWLEPEYYKGERVFDMIHAAQMKIMIKRHEKTSELISHHEIAEANPSVVCTQNGTVFLTASESISSVQDSWSKDYRNFRNTWKGLRKEVEMIIPLNGRVVAISDAWIEAHDR
ncbi:MAG: hypothetical protein HY286_00510 [Planctomycetes bacterium]|nr:hypothetical protein [Planctomycetota bacterium]